MGVYRRRKRDGSLSEFWSIKYPHKIDSMSDKIIYTTKKVGISKKEAKELFHRKMIEWKKKVGLGIEETSDQKFSNLVDWHLGLPKVKAKRSYEKDVQRAKILKEDFGHYPA
jgi:hypothetical protein